jgi:DNA ligase (NAD+)
VIDIVEQVGRKGKLTPVAILEPVKVAGVVVTRVNLYNRENIERLGLSIGSSVVVAKAGDVIPEIVSAVPYSGDRPFVPATYCPSCGSLLASDRCDNRAYCPAQLVGIVTGVMSKDAMDVHGVSEGTVRFVHDQITNYDPEKTVSAQELLDAIAKEVGMSRFTPRPLARAIVACGLPGVGPARAKALAEHFRDAETFLESSLSEMRSVFGFDRIADEVHEALTSRPGRIFRWFGERGLIESQEVAVGVS